MIEAVATLDQLLRLFEGAICPNLAKGSPHGLLNPLGIKRLLNIVGSACTNSCNSLVSARRRRQGNDLTHGSSLFQEPHHTRPNLIRGHQAHEHQVWFDLLKHRKRGTHPTHNVDGTMAIIHDALELEGTGCTPFDNQDYFASHAPLPERLDGSLRRTCTTLDTSATTEPSSSTISSSKVSSCLPRSLSATAARIAATRSAETCTSR